MCLADKKDGIVMKNEFSALIHWLHNNNKRRTKTCKGSDVNYVEDSSRSVFRTFLMFLKIFIKKFTTFLVIVLK